LAKRGSATPARRTFVASRIVVFGFTSRRRLSVFRRFAHTRLVSRIYFQQHHTAARALSNEAAALAIAIHFSLIQFERVGAKVTGAKVADSKVTGAKVTSAKIT
jgi:hypothetical protein